MPNASTPAPISSGSNEFSKANVFSLFAALSFCLLTQPVGSLLYIKPRGVIGRIAFFFWRLNPAACLIEAILVFIVLLGAIYDAVEAFFSQRPSPVSFAERFRITASALLLLRRHSDLPERWLLLIEDKESGSASSAKSSRLIHHHEWTQRFIDLVAVASFIIVVVKLVTTVIPLHLHLAAACMVAGWVGIQLLVAMACRGESEYVLSETLVEHALKTERRLRKPAVRIIISIISSAIVGYIVFISIWGTPELSEDLKSWGWAIQGSWVFAIFCQVLTFPFIWGFRMLNQKGHQAPDAMPPENSQAERPEPQKPQQAFLVWAAIVAVPVVVLGGSAYLATVVQRHSKACQALPQLKASCVPDMIITTFQTWAPFALPTTFFSSGLLRNWQWGLVVLLMWNLIVTAVVFAGVLIRYDSQGTYKPTWLDWLG
ncbi:hypothetical protein AK830_g8615 [Neonectria ditissima]|uniref:Uncharacterized protein n=1 Tax=Neonectria ditissima TaxID=78410 RepID=A0A0P7BAX1_9HYPO|nr:hypothetical protein AK830_g8615 [Neonectria ditissima]